MRRLLTAVARLVRFVFAGAPWWLRLLEVCLIVGAIYMTRWISLFVWRLPNGDVVEYYKYALAFWTSNPPMHAFPVEYPPLAIVPFTLTQLPPFGDVWSVYAFWMGALVLLGYVGFLRFSTRRRAWVYVLYLVVGAAATLLARYDLVPALVTLAALWAAQRRRFGHAYVLLALGILLKLYPAFLVPLVLIEHWQVASARARAQGYLLAARRAWRWLLRGRPRIALARLTAQPAAMQVLTGLALCLGVVALGFLGPLIVNPGGTISGFAYAGDRPVQIESTPASILWLGSIVGVPAHAVYSFKSLNYTGLLDGVLKPLSALALLGGCLLVYWRQARGRLTLGQAFVACLCVVIVTNKIFSPQYLIWVLPLVAAEDGFDYLWLAICVLTTIDYPIIYHMRSPILTVPYTWQFMPVLALRNGLLLYVTVRAIFRRPVTLARPIPAGVAAAAARGRDPSAADDDRSSPEPALIG